MLRKHNGRLTCSCCNQPADEGFLDDNGNFLCESCEECADSSPENDDKKELNFDVVH